MHCASHSYQPGVTGTAPFLSSVGLKSELKVDLNQVVVVLRTVGTCCTIPVMFAVWGCKQPPYSILVGLLVKWYAATRLNQATSYIGQW